MNASWCSHHISRLQAVLSWFPEDSTEDSEEFATVGNSSGQLNNFSLFCFKPHLCFRPLISVFGHSLEVRLEYARVCLWPALLSQKMHGLWVTWGGQRQEEVGVERKTKLEKRSCCLPLRSKQSLLTFNTTGTWNRKSVPVIVSVP